MVTVENRDRTLILEIDLVVGQMILWRILPNVFFPEVPA